MQPVLHKVEESRENVMGQSSKMLHDVRERERGGGGGGFSLVLSTCTTALEKIAATNCCMVRGLKVSDTVLNIAI